MNRFQKNLRWSLWLFRVLYVEHVCIKLWSKEKKGIKFVHKDQSNPAKLLSAGEKKIIQD